MPAGTKAMTQAPNLKQADVHAPTLDLIQVVVIEDMREVREGLAALINGTRGFILCDL